MTCDGSGKKGGWGGFPPTKKSFQKEYLQKNTGGSDSDRGTVGVLGPGILATLAKVAENTGSV